MAKQVRIFNTHQESERFVLEQGFNRSPEERIRFLFQQLETSQKLNPTSPVIEGYQLKKKSV